MENKIVSLAYYEAHKEELKGIPLTITKDGTYEEPSEEEIVEFSPTITIDELKQQLADTDYKIIKCYEYQMAGKELPYDIVELNTVRDEIRDLISEMESANGKFEI